MPARVFRISNWWRQARSALSSPATCRVWRRFPIALLVAVSVLQGCTSMGHHEHPLREAGDFGPRETLRICLYLDRGIDEEAGRSLLQRAWRTEAGFYALDVEVVQAKPWRRPAFAVQGIMAELRRVPLIPPCDRILALLGRNVGDFLWSFVAPEMLGAVNTESLTHGYVVARRGSLNQLLVPPEAVARHEIYHLLGCGEHFDMPACYRQIAALKAWKRESGADFFPAWDHIGQRMLYSRGEVNARIGAAQADVAESDGQAAEM
jgi:hypothetical protein